MVALKIGAGAAARPVCVPVVDGFGEPAPVAAGQRVLVGQVIVLECVARDTYAGSEFSQGEVSDRRHSRQSNPLTTPTTMGIVDGMNLAIAKGTKIEYNGHVYTLIESPAPAGAEGASCIATAPNGYRGKFFLWCNDRDGILRVATENLPWARAQVIDRASA